MEGLTGFDTEVDKDNKQVEDNEVSRIIVGLKIQEQAPWDRQYSPRSPESVLLHRQLWVA